MGAERTAGAGVLARQALEVAVKDLRVEARSGEALPVILPFGAVALLLLPIAVGADLALLRQAGWGMFWVVVLLFGTRRWPTPCCWSPSSFCSPRSRWRCTTLASRAGAGSG